MDANEGPRTVAQILDRYERECVPELATRTQQDYRRHLAHLRSAFGERIACDLVPKDFAPFMDVRKGKIQRNRQMAVLSAAFTIACRRWFWLPANVLRDVQRHPTKPRDRLISDEEFLAIRTLAPLRVRLAMDLALVTGQRQGDILSLRWTQIREMADGTNALHLQQAKTGKRIAIEVSAELERILDRCWLLPKGGKDGCAFVLPNRNGDRYTSEGFRAVWQRVMRKWRRLGRENLTFHDIRALCATKCPTLEYASYLLGHASTAMTRRVYFRGVQHVKPLATSLVGGSHEPCGQHRELPRA